MTYTRLQRNARFGAKRSFSLCLLCANSRHPPRSALRQSWSLDRCLIPALYCILPRNRGAAIPMGMIRSFIVGLAAFGATALNADAERPIRMDAQGVNPEPSKVPSFDCTKAQGFVEISICSDFRLGFQDRSIAETYQRLLLHTRPERRAIIRQDQLHWLHERNTCTLRNCLESALDARGRALSTKLSNLDKALRANVRAVGQCEVTRIDFIGARLTPVEGEAPQGTSIGYANGVWQVSYNREQSILRSQVSDPVRVCLASVPKDCPSGDARGREYSVENLRTRAKWKLPDASHSCGGA